MVSLSPVLEQADDFYYIDYREPLLMASWEVPGQVQAFTATIREKDGDQPLFDSQSAYSHTLEQALLSEEKVYELSIAVTPEHGTPADSKAFSWFFALYPKASALSGFVIEPPSGAEKDTAGIYQLDGNEAVIRGQVAEGEVGEITYAVVGSDGSSVESTWRPGDADVRIALQEGIAYKVSARALPAHALDGEGMVEAAPIEITKEIVTFGERIMSLLPYILGAVALVALIVVWVAWKRYQDRPQLKGYLSINMIDEEHGITSKTINLQKKTSGKPLGKIAPEIAKTFAEYPEGLECLQTAVLRAEHLTEDGELKCPDDYNRAPGYPNNDTLHVETKSYPTLELVMDDEDFNKDWAMLEVPTSDGHSCKITFHFSGEGY
jgi:hypothetical protein